MANIENGFVVKHLLDGGGHSACGLTAPGNGIAYGAHSPVETTCPDCLYFLRHGDQLNYTRHDDA